MPIADKAAATLPPQQVWRMTEWRHAARVSRNTYEKLPPEQRPKTVIVGNRPRVIESPLEWLLRIDKRNGNGKRRGQR